MGTHHSGECVGPHGCRTSCRTHASARETLKDKTLKRKTLKRTTPSSRARPTRPRRWCPEQTEPLAPWTTANRRRHFLFSELRSERRRTARSRADRPPELRASLRFDITPIHATTHLPLSSL